MDFRNSRVRVGREQTLAVSHGLAELQELSRVHEEFHGREFRRLCSRRLCKSRLEQVLLERQRHL